MLFTIDDKRIAHQFVEGEVIAIDFVTGTYFSMRSTAADIWTMLAGGASLEAVVAAVTAQSDAAADAGAEIEEFVQSLIAAELISPSDQQMGEPIAAAPAGGYSTPLLEKFEDMSELITLDPVHEVGEMGWPHVPHDRS